MIQLLMFESEFLNNQSDSQAKQNVKYNLFHLAHVQI